MAGLPLRRCSRAAVSSGPCRAKTLRVALRDEKLVPVPWGQEETPPGQPVMVSQYEISLIGVKFCRVYSLIQVGC